MEKNEMIEMTDKPENKAKENVVIDDFDFSDSQFLQESGKTRSSGGEAAGFLELLQAIVRFLQ